MNTLNSIIIEGTVANNRYSNGTTELLLNYVYNNKVYSVNTVWEVGEVSEVNQVSTVNQVPIGAKVRVVGKLLGNNIYGDHIDIAGNNEGMKAHLLEV